MQWNCSKSVFLYTISLHIRLFRKFCMFFFVSIHPFLYTLLTLQMFMLAIISIKTNTAKTYKEGWLYSAFYTWKQRKICFYQISTMASFSVEFFSNQNLTGIFPIDFFLFLRWLYIIPLKSLRKDFFMALLLTELLFFSTDSYLLLKYPVVWWVTVVISRFG